MQFVMMFFILLCSVLSGHAANQNVVVETVESVDNAPLGKGDSVTATLITLSEAVQQAVDTHPAVLGQLAARLAAEEGVSINRAGFLPSIDLRISAGYEKSHNEVTRSRRLSGEYNTSYKGLWRNDQSLTISQMLFDGFATSGQTKAARFEVESTGETLYDVSEQIGLRAIEAYLDVMRFRQLAVLAKENVTDHEETLNKVFVRAQAGGGPQADVEQTLSRLADAKVQLLDIEGGVRDTDARYLEVFGQFPKALVMPQRPKKLMPEDVATAVKKSLADNHNLKASGAQMKARQADLTVARAAYMPRVNIELSTLRQENLDGLSGVGQDVTGMAVVRYNLFHGGADSARRVKAQHLLRRARLHQAEVSRQVEQNARISFSSLETTNKRLPVLVENVAKIRKVLANYQNQFNLGKRSLLDLLDTQSELFNAKAKLLNGDIANTFAHYRMMGAMNSLLQGIGVAVKK